MKRMSFNVVEICICLLKDALTFEVDPNILLNCIEKDVSLYIVEDKLIFSAEE